MGHFTEQTTWFFQQTDHKNKAREFEGLNRLKDIITIAI